MSSLNKVTTRHKRAISLLLTSASVVEAAELAEVSERTLHRWLRDPLFLGELRKAESSVLDAATRRLLSLADGALDVLESILDDPDERTAQRRMSAVAVLDHLVRLRELRSVEDRLAALEARVYGES